MQCYWLNNSICCGCSDDIQGTRKIRISKNGTLNIYIAVDISESIQEAHVNHSKKAIETLISKVRNKQLSYQLKITLSIKTRDQFFFYSTVFNGKREHTLLLSQSAEYAASNIVLELGIALAECG